MVPFVYARNTVKCLEHGPFIQAVINQISVISSHIYRKLTLKLLLRQTQPFFGKRSDLHHRAVRLLRGQGRGDRKIQDHRLGVKRDKNALLCFN